MISRETSNTSVNDLLRAIHKMIVEIEVSSLRAANDSLIGQIKWSARKVDSVSESREQIDGVCFEDIAGGLRVYDWYEEPNKCHYIMFDDLKRHNIFDKILTFFGRKRIKPLPFGYHYGRYHVAGHYVEREEFIDYVKEGYQDVFCWILFNPEII